MTELSSANDLSSKSRTGLVQIFTGEGKGKTTAAAGTVLRALSHGLRVFVVVFMKGAPLYGEWEVLSKLPGVKIAMFGAKGFTDPQKMKPETVEQARQAFKTAREGILSGNYDLVVLDEINVAVDWKLVDEDEVVRLIEDKPSGVELILTGRYAHPKLVQLADLVTECLNIKHPYNKGIKARPGIEY